MAILNYKDFLNQVDNLPEAIEAKLPAGAPKLTPILQDITSKLPNAPNFPGAGFPDLPPVPPLPTLPGAPGTTSMRKRMTVTPQEGRNVRVLEVYDERSNPPPGTAVTGQTTQQVVTRRGM